MTDEYAIIQDKELECMWTIKAIYKKLHVCGFLIDIESNLTGNNYTIRIPDYYAIHGGIGDKVIIDPTKRRGSKEHIKPKLLTKYYF